MGAGWNVGSGMPALLLLSALAASSAAAAETLKVAVAQRGFWNSTFIDVGLKQGWFKEAGLDIDILYTEGGASTLTPVIAGSIDIAMTNGILGVVAAYLLVLLAFQRADAGRVATLRESSVLVAVALTRIARPATVWAGAALVALGAVLVSV